MIWGVCMCKRDMERPLVIFEVNVCESEALGYLKLAIKNLFQRVQYESKIKK